MFIPMDLETRKAVMNYRHIQGGQERSQTNEHGGNCDLSIASNLQMNNSKNKCSEME